jgi:hypothetical protein
MCSLISQRSEVSDQKAVSSKNKSESEFRNSKFSSAHMSFQVTSQQVKQREQKNPDDVHKVPVQT